MFTTYTVHREYLREFHLQIEFHHLSFGSSLLDRYGVSRTNVTVCSLRSRHSIDGGMQPHAILHAN
jgi:hypothetical protein